MDYKPKVYIASPYTLGNQADNVRISLAWGDILWDVGFTAFAPLLSHFWHFLTPRPYQEWHDWCLEWVASCDVVLRLPGESPGADDEVAFAEGHDIPVVYAYVDDPEYTVKLLKEATNVE